jgi:hypothetical protein
MSHTRHTLRSRVSLSPKKVLDDPLAQNGKDLSPTDAQERAGGKTKRQRIADSARPKPAGDKNADRASKTFC